jgi:serine/threonine protein kinase
VVHRDIKPENLLLVRNPRRGTFSVKIGDFGTCTRLSDSDETIIDFKGSEFYDAPEILARKPYAGKQADVFALGISLFNMLVGNMPFLKANFED